ncbi:glycosyl hydrolase family protein [Jeotgalibacillus sp. S-D1]|uniref:Ig-like domain-containing protein n=1 Tax=Jeotgalibacillus sp. S-D1 TaxID=2552189 RepID=UPI00105A3578|nr:Ig-like domain-containing protein [Jeotgalibacillus sp. S-D1]TDL32009.1 glycosyl hydrolase family protein [Jeotgalibacillus sp. S-D1]
MRKSKAKRMKMMVVVLVLNMLLFNVAILNTNAEGVSGSEAEAAAAQTITTMAPAGATTIQVGLDGGTGFEFPKFNNGASFEDVKNDIDLLVKQDGEWVSIDNNAASGWIYDKNFGNWWEGPGGYWFNPVEETMQVRVASKTNTDVFVEYTLNVTPADPQVITSMAPAGATSLDVSPSGGTGFEFPKFNSGATFKDVKDDVALFVKQDDEWVSIDNNAGSGWVYDKNFGNWWEGPGGYWFDPVEETMQVRVASKTNPDVFVDYTLKVTVPVRNSHVITNYDGRATFEADKNGAIGMPIPKIDGGAATKKEVDNFVYEVKVDGEWVNILDAAVTGFSYSANGYNRMSSANQWGYWTDYIFGLWFQPVQEDVELRIGYPLDGEKGGDIGSNYVQYKFIGNPDAYRPDDVVLDDIQVGTSEDSAIEGWDLEWNDEFDGTELDESKWNYDTGYYLNDDPGTWGWGNNELQHYTDSEENVFVEDGKLTIKSFEDPKTFPQDPERVAPYSSGKITTEDKFKFKYGRVDFSAKLPAVSGAWPALWMLPNDEVYGSWASSGEIDVMEARGRVPGTTSGALHFGGEWPQNTYLSGEQNFEDGGRIDTDYHVYSLIWEEDAISWYVDGKFFYRVTKEEWFSAAVQDNPYAPFDQDFYLIMNLAMGGWFDGGVEPAPEDFPVSMQVDYVRVYSDPETEEEVEIPVTGVEINKSEVELTAKGQTSKLSAAIAPSNATNKKVTWSSSDNSVATVSTSGVVTAVANGTADITVTTEDGNKVDTAKVIVDIIPKLPLDQLFPLKNGSFSQELSEWSAWSWKDKDDFIDEIEVKNGKAEISIPAFDKSGEGAEKWAVQFKQTDLQLYKDKEYLVSFDASSTIPRDMELVIQNSEMKRVFEKEISLTEESQRYTYSFKASAEEAVELNFLLGKYADSEKHGVTIDNVVLEMKHPAENKIKNPSFKDGNASWALWSDVGATSKIEGEKNKITIPSLGNEFWSIQFSQLGLALEESKSYRLVVDLSSSIGRKIDAIVESADYDKYLWEKVEINEELNTYAIEFTHEKKTDPAAKLVLALGKVEGQKALEEHVVTVDNVHLYEIPALPAEDENPEEPEPEKEGYGVGTIKENSVEFYVNDAPWAIIHYIKNGTTQQNINMNKAGENYSVYTLDVKEGDEIKYWFTYGLAEGGQAEYGEQVYTHKFAAGPVIPTANEVSDQSKEVTGETEAGSVVTVTSGTKTYTATSDASGAYKVKIPKQKAGSVLKITATDADGNVSKVLSITVKDKTAPNKPTADKVSDQSTAVTGKVEAGSVVTVTNKKAEYTATANAEGAYEVTIPKQKAGSVLKITATDEAGNVSKELKIKVKDKTAPKVPTVKEVSDHAKQVTGKAEAGSVVTVMIGNKKHKATANTAGVYKVKIPKQKAGTIIKVTAKDAAGNTSDTATVSVVDKTAPPAPKVKNVDSKSVSVTGKAEANAKITVKAGKKVLGTSKADRKGNFKVKIPKQKQSTVLHVTATDAENNTSKATKVTVKK